jgi:two-component system nitrate/nitrite response regulator NarL
MLENKITLIIAEDHQSLIDGLRLSLEFEDDIEVIGEANDGEKLIELVRKKRPNIVITDIRMPLCDGIAATKIITAQFPETKVIAFSMFENQDAIAQMKAAGASGYITKNAPLSTVIAAIRAVHDGSNDFISEFKSREKIISNTIILSAREKDILKGIGQGKSSQEIADDLFLSKGTVDTHRKNILKKMKIEGKTDLMLFAIERKYDF